MKSQVFLFAFLVGVILVSAEEKKSDAKPVEPETKKDKRGLLDFGYGHGFDSFDNHGLSLDNHHHKEHITHDIKEIKVPILAPYPVHIEKKVHVPYPVKVPVHVANPVPVPFIKHYPVPVEKLVPYPVEKHIPVPVKVPVEVPYPVKVPVHIEKPYPVHVVKKVPYAVKQPYLVEKEVPYFVKEHHHGHHFEGFGHGLEAAHHY